MYINFINDRKFLGYECLIDTQCGNRLVLINDSSVVFVKNVSLNGKRKAKRLFVHGMFLFQLGQPLVPCAAAVMLPLPPAIERLSPFEQDRILENKNSYPQIASIVESKTDKMILTDQQIEDLNLICYKLQNGSITLDKAILKLRAGDFYDWATLAFIIYMFSLQQGNSFQNVPLPHQDPFGWWSGKYDSKNVGSSSSRTTTCLEMEKPASMPQQEYSSMTKEQRRNLPDKRDGFINEKGHPLLIARYGQVEFKTPDHGEIHGLPVNQKGKTLKTNENVLALRDSLVDMPNRKNIQWFHNGGYQKGTERGYDSVNLYDPDTGVIAVYRKQEDGEYCLFTTTCQLTPMERDHLIDTNGNFVTERVLKEQNWVSPFESDGMGITPISPMDENSSPNLGFTATNSFESDVMGITPIDNSQSNNP